MNSFFKLVTNLGLIAFLLISFLLIVVYFDALYEKISRPTIKNLRTDEFVWLGILVTAAVIADLLIMRRFIDALGKKTEE